MRIRVGFLLLLGSIFINAGCGGGSSNSNNNNNTTPPALPQASSLSSQPGCASASPGGSSSGPNCSIQVTGGTAPYTWNVTASPDLSTVGLAKAISPDTTTLTINAITSSSSAQSALAHRRLAGANPSTDASVLITATVTDAKGHASSPLSFTMVVTIKAVGINSTSLPTGTVGVAYSASVSGSGGAPPYSWTITGLPAGLSSTGALISGTPTQSGTFTITVRINDSEAKPVSVQVTLSLTISPAASSALTITTPSPLTGATLSGSYSTAVSAAGGTGPYSFSLASGSALPPGLNITSGTPSATIAGTPSETGTFQFTLDVQDSASSPAKASAVFTITVTGSSTLNCPATVSLTLCGTYALGLAGVNASQGYVAFGAVIVVNNSGNVISGAGQSNDSVAGHTQITFTGGTWSMDSSGDGRGVLTLIDSTAAVRTFHFVLQSPTNNPGGSIVEFDSSGVTAQGSLVGPESLTAPTSTNPIPPLPAGAVLALPLEGVNASNQRAALLGSFRVGAGGCNGSAGSFNSLSGEPIVTNTAGTVNASLSATGSCTAPDPTGVGTIQIALSGGSPFSTSTLHLTYLAVAYGGMPLGAYILGTDTIGSNQPILSGQGTFNSNVGVLSATLLAANCPCVSVGKATTNGTVAAHTGIARIIRLMLAATSGTTGSASGVIDENAAGTITSQGTWAYTSFAIDPNGSGTFTGSGQPTIHFILGNDLYSLDEGTEVGIGDTKPQNSVSIESAGQRYVIANGARTLGGSVVSGVVTLSGTSSGTISGTLDVASDAGSSAGAIATGTYGAPTYISLDATTGHGTGTANLTNTSSLKVAIQAVRHRKFLLLDVDPSSTDPFLMETDLQ